MAVIPALGRLGQEGHKFSPTQPGVCGEILSQHPPKKVDQSPPKRTTTTKRKQRKLRNLSSLLQTTQWRINLEF
jgi:hypothetical protein